jgi:hypothetical protein
VTATIRIAPDSRSRLTRCRGRRLRQADRRADLAVGAPPVLLQDGHDGFSTDLLWACREVAARAPLVGADIVEVLPTQIGAADITALVGSRLAHEILTGLAIRRLAHDRAPEGVPGSGDPIAGALGVSSPAGSARR